MTFIISSITRSSSPSGLSRSNLGCCLRHQLGHLAVNLTALLEQLCTSPTPSDFPSPLFYLILRAVNIAHASSTTPLLLLLARPSTLLLRTRHLNLTTASSPTDHSPTSPVSSPHFNH